MSNTYPISYLHATKKFTLPQELLDYLDLFSPPFRSIFLKEMEMMGEQAFYEKIYQLASYQIFIGVLKLEDIPGRKEFFDYYKNDKVVSIKNRTAPGREFVCHKI